MDGWNEPGSLNYNGQPDFKTGTRRQISKIVMLNSRYIVLNPDLFDVRMSNILFHESR